MYTITRKLGSSSGPQNTPLFACDQVIKKITEVLACVLQKTEQLAWEQ
jgi:hypothetical protein